MKAFLLAAGRGTRLRPYTDRLPKCLIPIHGRPLLRIWIDLLMTYGVDDIFINTHHHAGQVERFVKEVQQDVSVSITTGFEKELLGSGGTLLHNRWFVDGCEDFVIAYADNLTRLNLDSMRRAHLDFKQNGAVLTMGLFHTPAPQACGIAVLQENGKIISFVEKPQNPVSRLANAGIYIATKDFFNYTPTQMTPGSGIVDLGFHILPAMVGRMYGYVIPEYLRDIGTVESYYQALKEWHEQGSTTA